MDPDDIDDMDFDLPQELISPASHHTRSTTSTSSTPATTAPSFLSSAHLPPASEAAMRDVAKSWTVIYPINISSTGKQHRKLALAQCPTRTPSALYIAECVRFLGLPAAFEPEKRHPADPLVFGRVRVQIRDPATLQPLNPNVRTKRQLVKEVARYYPGIEMKMNEQDPRMPAMAAASRSEASSVVEALAKDAAGGAATTTTATTTSTTTAAASAASVSGGSGGSSSSGKKKKGKRK